MGLQCASRGWKSNQKIPVVIYRNILLYQKKKTPNCAVFDFAAKARETSLKDVLEKGPCLLNDLTGVLLCFHRFKTEIAGDISNIFLRILLDPEDCRFHRFLWRTKEEHKPTITAINCVIFGDAALPSLASYVIKRVVKGHGAWKPKATHALDRDLYMDDLIHSCKNTGEATMIVNDVCLILDHGGMKMRNSISNRPCVLQGVPDRVKDGHLQLDRQKQKVLAMIWDPQYDQIRFRPEEQDIIWTKTGVLRRLAMLFYPMGLLAAFLVRGKMLMQESWRGNNCDDPLEHKVKASWSAWFQQFDELVNISVQSLVICSLRQGKQPWSYMSSQIHPRSP